MNNRWMVNVTDKVGFSCYDVIDIDNIVDMGDTYNIMAGDTDMYLDKKYCDISGDLIKYRDNHIEIYMELL